MNLSTEWVEYGPSKSHRGYFAYAARAQLPLPTVLVVQEAWGLDEHIQDVTRLFAQAGYAAFAPDLYVKHGKRPTALLPERIAEAVALVNAMPAGSAFDPAARKKAFAEHPADRAARIEETMAAIAGGFAKGLESFLPPLEDAVNMLRNECSVTKGAKVACVGYCMGGGMAALLATRDPKLAAACIYYGTPPPADGMANIQCPLEGFYGQQDERFVKPLPEVEAAMKKAGKSFKAHIYQGAGHAFFNNTRPSYHAAAARDALAHTLDLFNKTLN